MEPSAENVTYHVYCQEEVAQKLLTSGQIQWLGRQFKVSVEYQQGRFLIHRNNVGIQQHQQAKHMLIQMIKQVSPTPQNFQWFWTSQRGPLPFDPDSNVSIEKAFHQGVPGIVLNIKDKLYNIDLQNFQQVGVSGGIPRPIMRVPPYNPNAQPVWIFTEGNRDRNLPSNLSQSIEKAFQAGQPTCNINFNRENFTVEFSSMTMSSQREKKEFYLRRA